MKFVTNYSQIGLYEVQITDSRTNSPAATSPTPARSGEPLTFIVALRAIAALVIVWHHFAIYPPLREWAAPLFGSALDWLQHHARTTQVFFAISGYLMARSMSSRAWGLRQVGGFILQRYCRLGLPYLGAIALVVLAYAFARDWMPDEVVGAPVSWPQFLAHLFFLQDLLGFEQLSAGMWFVCINFQLGLVYVAGLWLRDKVAAARLDMVGLIGWPLAALSLFHFNLDPAWDGWWLYFFPYFFLGVVIQRSLRRGAPHTEFLLYLAMLAAAMAFEWRWRLLSAVLVGLMLYTTEASGLARRWPRSRIVHRIGQISFSLFLVHFPVLVLVGALWVRQDWTSPEAATAGLVVAFIASLAAAEVFHRLVEAPSARLARRVRTSGPRQEDARAQPPRPARGWQAALANR